MEIENYDLIVIGGGSGGYAAADYRREALESGKFVLYRSNARFTGAHEIELADGRRLRGEKFLMDKR